MAKHRVVRAGYSLRLVLPKPVCAKYGVVAGDMLRIDIGGTDLDPYLKVHLPPGGDYRADYQEAVRWAKREGYFSWEAFAKAYQGREKRGRLVWSMLMQHPSTHEKFEGVFEVAAPARDLLEEVLE